jgi:regulator of replication initiation timing
MTGLEAIPKIAALLTDLIERVKDRKTAALVQQIQSLHQVIVADNTRLLAENRELQRKLSQPQEAERCEFCRKPSAEVVEIAPHENSQFAMMGIKIYHYRCSSCGKTFTKQKNS